jgi:hypothetical protein
MLPLIIGENDSKYEKTFFELLRLKFIDTAELVTVNNIKRKKNVIAVKYCKFLTFFIFYLH